MGEVSKPPPWRRSPHDRMMHLIRREGGPTSEAFCQHSAPTDQMDDGDESVERCHICVMVLGMEIAERGGDPGNFRM